MSEGEIYFYEFDSFRIDLREKRLLHRSEVIPLTPKVFDTLLILVQNSARVMEKQVLMMKLWPDSFVEESNLSQNISLLRKALHEGEPKQQYIKTVPKRGYQFVAAVREITGGMNDASCCDFEKTEIITKDCKTSSGDASVKGQAATGSYESAPSRMGRSRAWVLACLLLAFTLSLIYIVWCGQPAGKLEGDSGEKSITIVPFRAEGVGDEKELLGLGMADTLIIKLSKVQNLSVRPTSSVYKYVTGGHDALTIGRELGTDFVLDGTLQRSGKLVRVSVQLINVRDGRVAWAGKFDEKLTDIFEVHDLISEQVAQALTPRLSLQDQERLAKRHTSNTKAYEAYVTGLYFWNKRGKATIGKAITYLEQAVEKDPSYALAFAILSDCYYLSLSYNYEIVPASAARTRQIYCAKRALELDTTLAEAHMAMASVKNAEGDYRGAESEYSASLELNPFSSITRLRYSYFLLESLRLDKALEQMKKARELDPVSPTTNGALCYLLRISRQGDEAIKYCRRSLELDPQVIAGNLNLGEAYLQKGLYEEAINELKKVRKDNSHLYNEVMAYAHSVTGRRSEALKHLSKVQESPGSTLSTRYNIILTLAALGESNAAFVHLHKLPLDRFSLVLLKFDPQLDPLRSDPRFASFLRDKGLEHLLADR